MDQVILMECNEHGNSGGSRDGLGRSDKNFKKSRQYEFSTSFCVPVDHRTRTFWNLAYSLTICVVRIKTKRC